MNADVVRLCEAVRDAGGRAMLVGGSVRDRLLGIESKDSDIEVYGVEPARLREILEQIGPVNAVGEHFSVYKLVFYRPAQSSTGDTNSFTSDDNRPRVRYEIDVSIPRRESKSGRGHRGFVIEGDPSMRVEEAARRRDFTINAILVDPLTNDTCDPYGGREDLARRVLRAVASDTFVEDSLRVLRAVQLAARFAMTIDPQTVALCRTIDLSDLPRERVWGEIEKLLTLADRPSIGLKAADDLRVLEQLFPEIAALKNKQSRLDNQSDQDALTHTGRALDAAVELTGDLSKPERIAVLLATLCHELGETTTTSTLIDSTDQEGLGVLKTLGVHTIAGYDVRSEVLALIREHLKPREFYQQRDTIADGDFRRLAQNVDMDLLYRVSKACAASRRAPASTVAEDWFIEKARSLGVEHGPPAPLLLGRHLLDAGFQPGPQIGKVLRSVYELQLDGEVTTRDEALAAAQRIR